MTMKMFDFSHSLLNVLQINRFLEGLDHVLPVAVATRYPPIDVNISKSGPLYLFFFQKGPSSALFKTVHTITYSTTCLFLTLKCYDRIYVFDPILKPKETVSLTKCRLDQILHSDVTDLELREFGEQWNVPVLKIANLNGPRLADGRGLDGRANLEASAIPG